jgi:predicted MFS family arabinose efflux permease
MGMAGLSALVFGHWYDSFGLKVLVPGLLIGVAVTPLSFLGGFAMGLVGMLLWGASLGVHEAVMDAAVAGFLPEEGRARGFGLFSALYGVAWFAGSAVMGLLYDRSIVLMVAVSAAATLLAFMPLVQAMRARPPAA